MAQDLRRKISGYNLLADLEQRLQIVVNGGVARSTIYKAFSKGPITPTLSIIIETAEEVIRQHESRIAATA